MESTPTSLPGSSPDEMFPALTAQQQARVLAHGRSRKVRSGETIVEPNAQGMRQGMITNCQDRYYNYAVVGTCVIADLPSSICLIFALIQCVSVASSFA